MDIKIFAGANTRDGFVGFYDKLKEYFNLKKFFILKGTPGSGKSTFIKNFRNAFASHQAFLLVCGSDPTSLDGVIFPDLGVGMIDGTFPHTVDDGEIVTLADCQPTAEIESLTLIKRQYYEQAYKKLKLASNTHAKIEALYKTSIDFSKHKKLLDQCITSTWREGVFNN